MDISGVIINLLEAMLYSYLAGLFIDISYKNRFFFHLCFILTIFLETSHFQNQWNQELSKSHYLIELSFLSFFLLRGKLPHKQKRKFLLLFSRFCTTEFQILFSAYEVEVTFLLQQNPDSFISVL